MTGAPPANTAALEAVQAWQLTVTVLIGAGWRCGRDRLCQAAAGAGRLVVRARQMATRSAPRPNTTAANQTRPPRMGIRARTRRMPQPTRNARTQAVGSPRIRRPTIQAVAPYPSA